MAVNAAVPVAVTDTAEQVLLALEWRRDMPNSASVSVPLNASGLGSAALTRPERRTP
jgi:hypothetical protein